LFTGLGKCVTKGGKMRLRVKIAGSNKPAAMKQTPLIHTILVCLLFLSVLPGCSSSDETVFYKQIAITPDTLSIDNSTEVVITAPKGTVLIFEKESFAMPDGSAPKGRVSIVMKECYSEADMIRENLSTVSDGRLLETKGMVNIAAFADGQELKLKDGKEFIVLFPKLAVDGNKPMSLFYGERNDTGGINWKIDSNSLLRLVPHISTVHWMGTPFADSSYSAGLHIAGDTPVHLEKYVLEKFDIKKLEQQPDPSIYYNIDFIVDTVGKIRNINIKGVKYLDTDTGIATQTLLVIPPYIRKFVEQLPPLVPLKAKVDDFGFVPFDADCGITISFKLEPQAPETGETYSEQFRKKYAAFSNSSISYMNEGEFRFYSFSASKLGWINCDYFVNTPGPKIDFVVTKEAGAKPDIKLIFKKTKTIMQGQKQGGNMVFQNIPAGEEVKIVAISFKGNKPLLAIAHTKTSNVIFDKLVYKEFSLNELEKALSDQ
jgi:hypothetical protein